MITKALLSPGKIGSLELKNRVMFSPMGSSFPSYDGHVDDVYVKYAEARAKGGCALVSVEFSAVHANGEPPTLAGIYDDSYIPGLQKIVEAVHKHDAKALIQLAHCGRQLWGTPPHGEAVAASPLPCMASGTVAREMTEEDIWEAIEAFGDAALRAIKAGFDAIEVHCAHGYLIQNFLSPYSNIRTDAWGGSFENRSRFAREVMRNIRKKVGPNYPVITRISGWEVVPGGLTIEDQIEFAKMLEAEGSDAIDVSVGVYGYQHYLIPPIDMPIGLNVENAVKIKEHVNIPVMVVGRINDPIYAENLIAQGKVDFVVMGRGLLADPEFVNKFAEGRLDDIVKCVGCMEGCFKNSLMAKPITCMRNPEAGHEAEFEFKEAETKKKILVAGGGPGGLEAATRLQRRGHEVTLYEKSSSLGGLFALAGVAPRKHEMTEAALQMGRIAERAGVKIVLQTEVTPELIEEQKPDVVIVATGSTPSIPAIPGVDSPNVVTGLEILRGTATAKRKVVVIGGNVVGCEVADLLSSNGKDVTILEATDTICGDLDFVRQGRMFESLDATAVKRFTEAKCSSIQADKVTFIQNGTEQTITGVGTVVIATGSKPNDVLSDYLNQHDIEHYVIGDAKEVGFAIDAIHEAARLSLVI